MNSDPGSPGGAVPGLARPRGVADLFWAFSMLALQGFGGVLPWAHRTLVEQRRWLGREEFTELLAFAQLMPGPNVCNLSIMVGDRFFGLRGAIAGLAGMLLLPAVVVLALGLLHRQWADIAWVQRAIAGMGAVAAGLIIGTAIKLAVAQRKRWRWLAFGVAGFVAVGVFRWPLVLALAALGPVAVGLAWWREGVAR